MNFNDRTNFDKIEYNKYIESVIGFIYLQNVLSYDICFFTNFELNLIFNWFS